MLEREAFIPGDKEVLLKAVALALPTYTMSCFKLLVGLCTKLKNLMAQFWWRQHKEEIKIYQLSWARLCKPKSSGGLGFKILKDFNSSLLTRQGWHIKMEEGHCYMLSTV